VTLPGGGSRCIRRDDPIVPAVQVAQDWFYDADITT
jgi:hypothetical protein